MMGVEQVSEGYVVRVLQKLIVTVVLVAVCFVPTWLFLLLRSALNPEGFWQNFATGAAGLVVFGGIQSIFFIALIAIVFVLWLKPGRIWGE